MASDPGKKFIWKGVPLWRLEEMLIFIAKVVDHKGAVAQPLLDRIEDEYRAAIQQAQAQTRKNQSDRIKRLIEGVED